LYYRSRSSLPCVSARRRSISTNGRFEDLDSRLAGTHALYRNLADWRVSRPKICGFVLSEPESYLVDYSDPVIRSCNTTRNLPKFMLDFRLSPCHRNTPRHLVEQGRAGPFDNATQRFLHDACLQNDEQIVLCCPTSDRCSLTNTGRSSPLE